MCCSAVTFSQFRESLPRVSFIFFPPSPALEHDVSPSSAIPLNIRQRCNTPFLPPTLTDVIVVSNGKDGARFRRAGVAVAPVEEMATGSHHLHHIAPSLF